MQYMEPAQLRQLDRDFEAAVVDFVFAALKQGTFIDAESGNYDETTAYAWLHARLTLPGDVISRLVGQAFERYATWHEAGDEADDFAVDPSEKSKAEGRAQS